MFSPDELASLKEAIAQVARADRAQLDALREQVRALKGDVRPIRPRNTTAVSLVAADAGENTIQFNPFVVQPVRVVDSYGQVHFLDVLSPFIDLRALSERHIGANPPTALGRLMADLGVRSLWELSPMIPDPGDPPEERHPGWVKVYRDLGEWAALYAYLVGGKFVSHTVVLRDGLLRSKIFAGDLFIRMWRLIGRRLADLRSLTGRKVFVAGLAKRSKVLDRYRLAFYLERVLFQPGPCYLRVPREVERQVYRWAEYARGIEEETGGEPSKFVAGVLFLVKFGPSPFDPIWAVDLWAEQANDADEVFGYLLADAQAGFPEPFYPLCLQQAHERAALRGLDLELLTDAVVEALGEVVPDRGGLAAFRFAGGRREGRRGDFQAH